jgi:hypothetical protein
LPDGKLKNIILLRKPSGWYACSQVALPEPEFDYSLRRDAAVGR